MALFEQIRTTANVLFCCSYSSYTAPPCRIHVSLSCDVICQIVSLDPVFSSGFGWPHLSPIVVISSPSGDTRGPSVIFGAVSFPSTLQTIYICFLLSLTQTLVWLSLYVMLSILFSILVCAAASLFCACLFSVQGPYS